MPVLFRVGTFAPASMSRLVEALALAEVTEARIDPSLAIFGTWAPARMWVEVASASNPSAVTVPMMCAPPSIWTAWPPAPICSALPPLPSNTPLPRIEPSMIRP